MTANDSIAEIRPIYTKRVFTMNWVWAVFCAFGAASLFFAGRYAWQAPQRWRLQGYISNGLGYSINAEQNSSAFSLAIIGMRIWAALSFIGGLFALVLAFGWSWKAGAI